MKEEDEDAALSFIHIAVLTRNVIQQLKLQKQEGEDRERNCEPGNSEKEKVAQHRETVETRLNELRSFERRARGLGKN